MQERARDHQTPLHAAREFGDARLVAAAEADKVQEFVGPLLRTRPREAEVARVGEEVLADAYVRVEVVLLRDDAYERADSARVCAHVQTFDGERALGRRRAAGDHTHRGGLARAVRAEQAEGFAAAHLEVERVHGYAPAEDFG